jgi:hypothetical protein
MNEKVKRDIISILDDSLEYIYCKDTSKIKELSNHTIHNASIFQDQDSLSIAVIMYALSKIFDRKGYVSKNIVNNLKRAKSSLNQNNFDLYRKTINGLMKNISKEDTKLKLYIQEVIEQAQIKKGSKLYDHGISMAQAASLLGISQWDLMNYVGKTKISDTFKEAVPVMKRLKFTRGLFE